MKGIEMKRIALLASAAVTVGYSHGRVETVFAKRKGSKDPVRVNKSDYDADQEEDSKDRLYTGLADKPAASSKGVDGDVLPTAAPSAPDYSNGDAGAPQPPVDQVKNAAAPVAPSDNQIFVMKKGSGKNAKFFLCEMKGNEAVKIEGDRAKMLGIDENGYDTEEAAKKAQSTTEPSKAQ